MDPLFEQTLKLMDRAFLRLVGGLEPPTRVRLGSSFVFRYRVRSIEQALVQKLARIISGLRAAHLLLDHGFVQEQGVIQRTLDELNEDIIFLALARTNDTETDLHRRYLEAFFEEMAPEDWNPSARVKGPNSPRRKEIRAYINRVAGKGAPKSNAAEAISRAYSGYVHAASQNIMDMYGGDPPHFHLSGMLDTPRVVEHSRDLWNYLYRSFMSVVAVAKVSGDVQLVGHLLAHLPALEARV
jgi:hypothetical protein